MVQSEDKTVCLVKWMDNKPIIMLSSCMGKQPEGTVRRWSKVDKKFVDIKCPAVIMKYNQKMGGVDMSDRMLSYYRIKARTKKWTVRTILHLFDLAVVNSWLQYRTDRRALGDRPKDIDKLLEFKTDIAESLLSSYDADEDPDSDDMDCGVPAKNRRVPLPSTHKR